MPEGHFAHVGTRHYVQMHMMDYPVVKVLVTEDPQGAYWGWLSHKATEPCMIWPGEKLFSVCFGEPPRQAELRGLGHVLRLRVEPRNKSGDNAVVRSSDDA